MLKKFEHKIDKYDVVSFDVFDTLLVRLVSDPADVFLLTGAKCQKLTGLSSEEFKKRRIEAANQATTADEYNEPTLKDIYKHMNFLSAMTRERVMQTEMEIERSVLKANPLILDFYNKCVTSGKTIIATSDMYLSSSFIKEVLSKSGYHDIEKVYVSCECKKNKSSGKIYQLIEKEMAVPAHRILHIGDSWKSDYAKPKTEGWHSAHIQKIHAQSDSLTDTIIKRSVLFQNSDNYFYKLGYSVLGPILFGFCRWLNEEFESRGISTKLFLSRDGKIMLDAYSILYPDSVNTNYFHISRKAINVATLWMHPDFNNLRQYVEDTYSFSIKIFLKRIGLDHVSIETDLDLDQEYISTDFWNNKKIEQLYNEQIKKIAVSNSRRQYEYFRSYFQSMVKGQRIAIVDIGWRGSMQNRLEELIEKQTEWKGINVDGFYLGIESNQHNKHGYLYQSSEQSERKTIIDSGVGLFETLFLAHEGTTIGYREKDGKILPILDAYEIKDQETIEKVELIHTGARDFIHAMKDIGVVLLDKPDTDCTFNFFKKLSLSPTEEDINQLENITFNDTVNESLISTKSLKWYMHHSGQFKRDYHKAPWKIGFLKRNVNKHIDWGKIYMKAKDKI